MFCMSYLLGVDLASGRGHSEWEEIMFCMPQVLIIGHTSRYREGEGLSHQTNFRCSLCVFPHERTGLAFVCLFVCFVCAWIRLLENDSLRNATTLSRTLPPSSTGSATSRKRTRLSLRFSTPTRQSKQVMERAPTHASKP